MKANSHRVYTEVPEMVISNYNKAKNTSILCPPNAKRNPSHLSGHALHLIEYGPLYHIIVPRPPQYWKWDYSGARELATVKAFRVDQSGT